jgi:integrase
VKQHSRKRSTEIQWNTLTLPDDLRAARRLLLREDQPIVHLRDGEVVLFKRGGTRRWHCRYKLRHLGWINRTTRTANLEDAAAIACEWYDEARFRQRAGLAPETKTFRAIAAAAVSDMQRDMAAGIGRRVFKDYCSVIERYLTKYFGSKYLQNITAADVAAFEAWRNTEMQRVPATSTLLTFAAAWTRVIDTAVQRGWISAQTPVPRLSVRGGVRAKSRPAFRREEIQALQQHMQTWAVSAPARVSQQAREMRLLLRDYVELLLYTGMRHGTEAMRVQWRHCEWHRDGEQRYLRIWVSGKTGERWLIAKHEAVTVLERLRARDVALREMTLDAVFAAKIPRLVFAFTDGTQPYHFNAAFTRLLTSAGLLVDRDGENRTLYSLRHTYATQELAVGTDIHTLARQMGTSVLMLEKYYSKVNATLMAGELA